jgi:AraC-like DNA-binding protein
MLVIAGNPRLAQDGRASQLRAGEFAIYDFTRPYDITYDSAHQFAVFNVPRELLSLPVSSVGQLTAVPITPEGAAAVAAPLLERVATDVEKYGPDSAARLSTIVTDLIATVVAERIDQAELVSSDTQRRVLLVRIHDFIERHLGETELAPEVVAAAHHVSVRYLHRLFESQPTTVAAWIRRRRLERCRKDLADPALHTVPVSAIAARWGLLDATHFSRLFRQTYGLPPRDYRYSCVTPSF